MATEEPVGFVDEVCCDECSICDGGDCGKWTILSVVTVNIMLTPRIMRIIIFMFVI